MNYTDILIRILAIYRCYLSLQVAQLYMTYQRTQGKWVVWINSKQSL